jgi:predicted NBD/HSP70 family sugar kinase
MRLIAGGQASSRANIARQTGLARSTVGLHVEKMISEGLIIEASEHEGLRGRPSLGLKLARGAGYSIVLDFERTMLRLAISDAAASILASSEVRAALVDSPDAVLKQVFAEADALITRSGLEREDIHQVVASIPAPVDFTNGVTGHSHIMSRWEGFPLRATLSSHFDAATLLDNNANLMALGAAATLHPDQLPLLYLHCSLGIGAGMVTADGLIHRGADGSAGDVGHLKMGGRPGVHCLCGKSGCVGAAASLRAVIKELGLDGGGGVADDSEVGQIRSLVKAGDLRAGSVLRDAASRLGELTAALVDMFNPRTVVVGGELIGLGDDVLANLRGVVYQEAMPIATRNLIITVATADRDLALKGGAMAGAQALLH